MADKYLRQNSGQIAEVEATVVSTGAPEAGDIPALDSTGKLDPSVMPVGVVADTKSVVSSENLAAGDFVNVYNNSGTLNVRKADASNGRRAHGFVLAGVTSPAAATVYLEGTNTQLSGLTVGGTYYISGATAGAATATAPSTTGYIVQEIGVALSATEISFEAQMPITLA